VRRVEPQMMTHFGSKSVVVLIAVLIAGVAFGQERQKVVIPFDFESRFDRGRYGQMVGDMIWQKLHREGGFVIPDSMNDVRDYCSMNQIRIGAESPLEEVRKVVKNDFDADIGIWGSVERAPGYSGEVYDIVIKCVDFSSSAEPRVIYEKSARTNSVSEIPHLYVQEMLDALYERQPGGATPKNPIAEENWAKNPNLILGGDFEKAIRGIPVGWEDRGGQEREPLGRLVTWTTDPSDPSNHVIRFAFDQGVGDSTGVMYYSLPFQVQEGATYRFQCRWRSDGPAVKVFIKCYAEMPSEYRLQQAAPGILPRGSTPVQSPGQRDNSPPRSAASSRSGYPDWSQMRECYRSQQNLKGPLNTWNVHTEDFTPRHTQYTPTWGRVMLYAYLGAGKVEFDDVVIKMILPASPGESKKDPRRSMESSVTIKEMEERERASQAPRSTSKQ